jgi:hypothetical protein
MPVFMESNRRGALWSGRRANWRDRSIGRLKAISQNTTYRVVFNCPAANELRSLIVTGDPAHRRRRRPFAGKPTKAIRASIELPSGVAYDVEDTTELLVTGRGIFSAMAVRFPRPSR